MLRGIPKCISPEMLKVLSEMGHQDKLVLCDANFPAERYKKYGAVVVRADGVGMPELLEAILPLFPLDTYHEKAAFVTKVPADQKVKTPIWETYKKLLAANDERGEAVFGGLERSLFYETCKDAYAFIQSGEAALYANLLLEKGIV